MSERFLEKLDRLGAEAGIETMTPAIRRFALLVRNDVVSGWPASKPWVGLEPQDFTGVIKGDAFEAGAYWANNILREKNA